MITRDALNAYKAGKKMLQLHDKYGDFYPALSGFLTGLTYANNISVEEHGYIVSALFKYGRRA